MAGSGDRWVWTAVIVLILLWVIGVGGGYAMGGLVHLLLVIAIVVILIRVIRGRRVL